MSYDPSQQQNLWNAPRVMAIGAVLGCVLVLAGIGFVFWSESKTINTAVSLEQGAANARTVKPDAVESANDGKLVHLSGEATTDAGVTDPDLGISVKALRLVREVEVYQWKETKKDAKKDAKPTFEYKADWSRDTPAQKFDKPKEHVNPEKKPYSDAKFNASDVKVGAFTLAAGQVEKLPADENLPVTDALLAKLPEDLKGRARADADGRLFVAAQAGSSPESPKVGDARIRYKTAKPQTISLVAKQTGATFEPFPTAAGEPVDLIRTGTHAASTMIEGAQTTGKVMGWIFRIVGFVLMTLALFLILRRQVSISSGATPDVGFEVSVALFAAGAALPLILIVIGGRWLVHQPLFGGGGLVAGLLALAGLVLVTRSRKSGLFAGLFGGGGKTWSTKEREYFRRIALDPENAKLRLEFAALLEKGGDPLGEFIRLDQEMEALPEGDPDRERLNWRVNELLNTHGRTWFQGLRKLGLEPLMMGNFFPYVWLTHGIIQKVEIDKVGILPQKAAELFAAAPGLREISFDYTMAMQPDFVDIWQVPQLEQIGILDLSRMNLTLDQLAAVLSSPYLENVTELTFRSSKPDEEAEAQRQAMESGGRTRPVLKPEAAKLLVGSSIKRLRVLGLSSNEIGMDGALVLAASDKLTDLRSLYLSYNWIGPRGMPALATCPHLKNLQELDLGNNALGPVGVSALATSPVLRQLRMLDLTENNIGAEGALALSKSANLANVTTLKLRINKLGSAGARALLASPHLGRLEVLDLSINEIDDAAILVLTANRAIVRLKELTLSYNAIGDAGFTALANWAGLARLTKLDLGVNKAGPDGIKALAESPHLRGLETLDVRENEVGLAGAQALANSTTLTKLQFLYIQETKLPPKGEQLLRTRFGEVAQLT